LIDRKEWFTLKNIKDENSIMILMSFVDMRNNKTTRENSTSVCMDNNCVTHGQSVSGMNHNINSSCISNNSIEQKLKINSILVKQKSVNNTNETNYICNKLITHGSNPCGQSTMLHNLSACLTRKELHKLRSPERSTFISPPSHRNSSYALPYTYSEMVHHNINVIQIKSPQKGDETGYLTTLDSFLEQNDFTELEINNYSNFLMNENKLNINSEKKMETAKIKKMKDNLKFNRDSKINHFNLEIKSYELKVQKGKENLDHNIKIFNMQKEILEKNKAVFNTNLIKLNSEFEKINLEKEIIDQNKKSFVNLNMMFFNGFNHKIPEINLNKMNNLLSTINSISTSKEKSFIKTKESSEKEIVCNNIDDLFIRFNSKEESDSEIKKNNGSVSLRNGRTNTSFINSNFTTIANGAPNLVNTNSNAKLHLSSQNNNQLTQKQIAKISSSNTNILSPAQRESSVKKKDINQNNTVSPITKINVTPVNFYLPLNNYQIVSPNGKNERKNSITNNRTLSDSKKRSCVNSSAIMTSTIKLTKGKEGVVSIGNNIISSNGSINQLSQISQFSQQPIQPIGPLSPGCKSNASVVYKKTLTHTNTIQKLKKKDTIGSFVSNQTAGINSQKSAAYSTKK
jgi:hypothetical protein